MRGCRIQSPHSTASNAELLESWLAKPGRGKGGRKVGCEMSIPMQLEFNFASLVPKTAKQEAEAWNWVEASVWTKRMLAALGNGVKGGKWSQSGQMPFSLNGDFSPCIRPTFWRANPDEETTDWRAVCGRTARTVRRAGRGDSSRPLSFEYHMFLKISKVLINSRYHPGSSENWNL